MLIAKLAETFENEKDLPIELPVVRDAVTAICAQDKIHFSAEDMDPRKWRATFYQYTVRPPPYADPELRTIIVYSKQVSIQMQRLICCKEIIHVLDKQEIRTDKPQSVIDLAEKLLGPISTEDFGLADLQAATDKIAFYQAMAILFPPAAWQVAKKKHEQGKGTEEIAKWASLPEMVIEFALKSDWPAVRKDLLDC